MKKRSKSCFANSGVSDALRLGLRANIRLWMSAPDGAGVFGDGKYLILRAIEEHGSLLAAVKETGISYRKAWADLRKAEECLGIHLLTRTRGGRSGGGTILTDDAHTVLSAYAEFRKEAKEGVEAAFGRFIDRTRKKYSPNLIMQKA